MEELCCVVFYSQGNNAKALPIAAHRADIVLAVIFSHGQDSRQQQFVWRAFTRHNGTCLDQIIRLTLMQCGIDLINPTARGNAVEPHEIGAHC